MPISYFDKVLLLVKWIEVIQRSIFWLCSSWSAFYLICVLIVIYIYVMTVVAVPITLVDELFHEFVSTLTYLMQFYKVGEGMWITSHLQHCKYLIKSYLSYLLHSDVRWHVFRCLLCRCSMRSWKKIGKCYVGSFEH